MLFQALKGSKNLTVNCFAKEDYEWYLYRRLWEKSNIAFAVFEKRYQLDSNLIISHFGATNNIFANYNSSEKKHSAALYRIIDWHLHISHLINNRICLLKNKLLLSFYTTHRPGNNFKNIETPAIDRNRKPRNAELS